MLREAICAQIEQMTLTLVSFNRNTIRVMSVSIIIIKITLKPRFLAEKGANMTFIVRFSDMGRNCTPNEVHKSKQSTLQSQTFRQEVG